MFTYQIRPRVIRYEGDSTPTSLAMVFCDVTSVQKSRWHAL